MRIAVKYISLILVLLLSVVVNGQAHDALQRSTERQYWDSTRQ